VPGEVVVSPELAFGLVYWMVNVGVIVLINRLMKRPKNRAGFRNRVYPREG
jgi:hypothetical protein